jgi:hypothetical protein
LVEGSERVREGFLLFLKKKKQKDFYQFACVAQSLSVGIGPRGQICKKELLPYAAL